MLVFQHVDVILGDDLHVFSLPREHLPNALSRAIYNVNDDLVVEGLRHRFGYSLRSDPHATHPIASRAGMVVEIYREKNTAGFLATARQ